MNIYCVNCEHECSEAAAMCPSCGHPLKAALEQGVQKIERTGEAPIVSRSEPEKGRRLTPRDKSNLERTLNDITASGRRASHGPASAVNLCPRCGAVLKRGTSRCDICDITPAASDSTQTSGTRARPDRRLRRYLGTTAILLLLAVLVAMTRWLITSKAPTQQQAGLRAHVDDAVKMRDRLEEFRSLKNMLLLWGGDITRWELTFIYQDPSVLLIDPEEVVRRLRTLLRMSTLNDFLVVDPILQPLLLVSRLGYFLVCRLGYFRASPDDPYSALVYQHRKALGDLIEDLHFFGRASTKYFDDDRKDLPVFACSWQGERCLVLARLASETVFNRLRLTAKQRAATFVESHILSSLRVFDKHLYATDIPIYGVLAFYGSKDFGDDNEVFNIRGEAVAVLVRRADCHDFVMGTMTREELCRRAYVFVKAQEAGLDFVRMELALE